MIPRRHQCRAKVTSSAGAVATVAASGRERSECAADRAVARSLWYPATGSAAAEESLALLLRVDRLAGPRRRRGAGAPSRRRRRSRGWTARAAASPCRRGRARPSAPGRRPEPRAPARPPPRPARAPAPVRLGALAGASRFELGEQAGRVRGHRPGVVVPGRRNERAGGLLLGGDAGGFVLGGDARRLRARRRRGLLPARRRAGCFLLGGDAGGFLLARLPARRRRAALLPALLGGEPLCSAASCSAAIRAASAAAICSAASAASRSDSARS